MRDAQPAGSRRLHEPSSRSVAMRAASSGVRRAPHSAAGSMPSASRSPISRNSSAHFLAREHVIGDDAMPVRSRRASAKLPAAFRSRSRGGAPSISSRPCAPGTDAGIFVRRASRRDCAGIRRRAAHGWKSHRPAGRARRRPPASCRRVRARHPRREFSSLPAGMQRRERRVRLDGQLIERQMLGRFGERPLKLDSPSLAASAAAAHRSDRTSSARRRRARSATASSASRAVCRRPSSASARSSSACTPSETRLTPAER